MAIQKEIETNANIIAPYEDAWNSLEVC